MFDFRCGRHVCDNSVHGQSWRRLGPQRESGSGESKSRQTGRVMYACNVDEFKRESCSSESKSRQNGCVIHMQWWREIINRRWSMLEWPSQWLPLRMLQRFSSEHLRFGFKINSPTVDLHFMQSMPILRAFCFFAGTGVIFLYIFACSYFVACLVLDERRR